jgi:PTH2 family peptidyl-tRNA hydrolase
MGIKQAIVVRTDLKMSRGKIAAQAAHGSVAALSKTTTSAYSAWVATGMKKIVLRAKSKKELLDLFNEAKKKFPTALVKDAGNTQLEPGTITCIAIGPADDSDIDRLTGKLRLL